MTPADVDQLARLLAEAIEHAHRRGRPRAWIDRLTAAQLVLREVTAP